MAYTLSRFFDKCEPMKKYTINDLVELHNISRPTYYKRLPYLIRGRYLREAGVLPNDEGRPSKLYMLDIAAGVRQGTTDISENHFFRQVHDAPITFDYIKDFKPGYKEMSWRPIVDYMRWVAKFPDLTNAQAEELKQEIFEHGEKAKLDLLGYLARWEDLLNSVQINQPYATNFYDVAIEFRKALAERNVDISEFISRLDSL
jgi:hypothetical protein